MTTLLSRKWSSGFLLASDILVFSCLIPGLIGGCSKKSGSPKGTDWSFGPAASYSVNSAGPTTIPDSITAARLVLPEGGHGTLKISRILTGPEAPYPGTGFSVSFDQETPLQIVVDRTGADVVMVMGYGSAPGAYDDIPGPSKRWVAMPLVDSIASGHVFQLTLPFTTPIQSSRSASALDSPNGFSQYWISSIPAGSDDATKRVALELQSKTFVDGVLDRLSPARQTAARAEVNGRLSPSYAWDAFEYSGFWWRSLGSMGRIVRPTIHLKLNANAGNVAHETGHYITHVLVGDDTWSNLEGEAPLWDNGHGIRDVVGRNMLLEDYAYYSEWLTYGSVKSYDLQDPYVIFRGMSPLTTDFPGLEGFAGVVLASLKRTTPNVRSIIGGTQTDVPVFGLTDAQVYDIIAAGATGIEGLQAQITTAVGAQADKLPAFFQRFGWRYSVKGRLITPEGASLSGATVASISVVGDHVYRGGSSSIPSGADGKFTIIGEVFPGASKIRVWNGQDSIDVPISIPWSKLTTDIVDLGDLTVTRPIDLTALHHCAVDLFTDANFDFTGGSQERYERVELTVPGSFSGGQFTGSIDTTSSGVRTIITLTATVDPQTGNVSALNVTKTREVPSSDNWTETLHLALANITKTSYSGYPPFTVLECSVFDEATCNHITSYSWSGHSDTYTSTMTSYNCVTDHSNGYVSQARVYFRN